MRTTEQAEREWRRFEDGPTPFTSAATHTEYLRRFVRRDDRVLDVGCGPGRFAIELARIGARVVLADVEPAYLELSRAKLGEAGLEDAVEARVEADVTDLSQFADGSFDATVCYGGPLSYVLDRAPAATAELARVTKPGGHLLVSAMCTVGPTVAYADAVLDIAREHGIDAVEEIVASGFLPEGRGGHADLRMYRWRELRALLEPHGEIVAATATGLFQARPEEPELCALLERLELDLGAEEGAIDAGQHILAVVRV